MLTIYIPTFNRVEQLRHVLSRLIDEVDTKLSGHDLVKIKVFNNGSTDETEIFLNSISRPYLFAHHRRNNIGARANLYDGINHCDTEFLWILGDDDLPMSGLLSELIQFLKDKKPNILYLPAIWSSNMLSNSLNKKYTDLKFREFDSRNFIKLTGIKITFISSFIINFQKFKSLNCFKNQVELRNTDFGHLCFYAPLILSDGSLFAVDDAVISATGNSNFQYSLVRSFSVDLPFVIKKLFLHHQLLHKILIRNLIISYLPSMIYSVKYHKVKSLEADIPWPEIQESLKGYFSFWFFVFPIKYVPKVLCLFLIVLGRSFR